MANIHLSNGLQFCEFYAADLWDRRLTAHLDASEESFFRGLDVFGVYDEFMTKAKNAYFRDYDRQKMRLGMLPHGAFV